MRPYHLAMRFSVLGPLAVHGPRGAVDVVGGKERTLLAHLVAAGGRVVTVDELADSLWDDQPPRSPGKALQTYVLRLRNALEPERRGVPTIVVTEGAGYRLAVAEHEVDAARFAHLAAAGRAALDAGRPGEAAGVLREALDLWRGPAYAGFEETGFGRAERQRLDELRVGAREDRWAAEVDLGGSAAAVSELELLVADHPWRERAWRLLALALFRADRQGEALNAVERARSRLAEDLGVDPGPELRDLHARVLAQDPSLMRLPDPVERSSAGAADPLPAASRAERLEVVREEVGSVTAAGDALRGGRAALVEGICALQTSGAPAVLPPDVCPWRGLESYDVEDRPWFAGRERLVAELLARLSSERLVAVVGASGSGKSSLVRAGMLGALAEDALPGSAGWTTLVMRPGASPMRQLAAVALGAAQASPSLGDLLLRLAEQGETDDVRRTVLVVDQLEEVWTSCDDSRERESFLDALAGIAHETDARVVLVVRGDYFPRLAEHAALASLARDATLLVGAPSPAEVRRMVEVPARAAGLTLDTGLAETLTDDAGQEPGLLPLLSTSLLQLWERRDDRRLTYADYVAIGGLPGAVAHLAEEAYHALAESDRGTARVVLLRLAGRSGSGEVVRRRVPLAELEGLPGSTGEVAAALAGARLLTLTGDAVEVAHESLFREWPGSRGGSPTTSAPGRSSTDWPSQPVSGTSRTATPVCSGAVRASSPRSTWWPSTPTRPPRSSASSWPGPRRPSTRSDAPSRSEPSSASGRTGRCACCWRSRSCCCSLRPSPVCWRSCPGSRRRRPVTARRRPRSRPTPGGSPRRRSTRSSSTWPYSRPSRRCGPSPVPRPTAPCSACWRARRTCSVSGEPRHPSSGPTPATTARSSPWPSTTHG